MNLKEIEAGLHTLERKVLPTLTGEKTVEQVASDSGLQEVEVVRAFQWLQNKNIITLKEDIQDIATLGKNGVIYREKGLPESRFLKALTSPLTLEQVAKKAQLEKEEVGVCLGALKSKAAITVEKNGSITVSIAENGKRLLERGFLEEAFLKKTFPLAVTSLKDEEKFALDNLKKRKEIVIVTTKKTKSAILTSIGQQLIKQGMSKEAYEDRLTPEMLRSHSWKNKKFRRFDVSINVPSIYGGKKQPYRIFLDEVRRKFVSLGFQEMSGPLVESDFWDMDALYMPQFHAARDIHDAYYVKEPNYGKIDPTLIAKVKESHENGGKTGSRGWGYEFDSKRTQRLLLRTQGTSCSARMLASKDLKVPGKYFGVTRCFRYDVIDATHLADFHQTEGFVIEDGLNFRHLVSLLKMFAEEFCQTDQIKIRPGYFPFTEPSAELFAKHPELGWIELGGSGMFRPEMLRPLGIDKPVIAWGIGIDRIGMFSLGMNDIRQLFSHDLAFLRKQKVA